MCQDGRLAEHIAQYVLEFVRSHGPRTKIYLYDGTDGEFSILLRKEIRDLMAVDFTIVLSDQEKVNRMRENNLKSSVCTEPLFCTPSTSPICIVSHHWFTKRPSTYCAVQNHELYKCNSYDRESRTAPELVKQSFGSHVDGFLKVYQKLFPDPSIFPVPIHFLQHLRQILSFINKKPLLYVSSHPSLYHIKHLLHAASTNRLNSHAIATYLKLRGAVVLEPPVIDYIGHNVSHSSAFLLNSETPISTVVSYWLGVTPVTGYDLQVLYNGVCATSPENRFKSYDPQLSGNTTVEYPHELAISTSPTFEEPELCMLPVSLLCLTIRLLNRDPSCQRLVEGINMEQATPEELQDLSKELEYLDVGTIDISIVSEGEEIVEIDGEDGEIQSRVIESNVKLSDSILWDISRGYYDRAGTYAWGDEGIVPSFITTNSFIADRYAKAVLAFMMDHPSPDPLYIIDLGAGTGKFGFLFLNQLSSLIQSIELNCPLQSKKLCYVLTDFTESNVNWWRNQPQLRHYVRRGVLDFAVFNAEHDTTVHLMERDIKLEPETNQSNIVAIANYLFDSLSCDVFQVNGSELHQGLVTSRLITEDHESKLDQLLANPNVVDKIQYHFIYEPVSATDYYPNELWCTLLSQYRSLFEGRKQTFFFPIGAFRCIENMRRLSNKLVILSSDKGMVSLESIGRVMLDQPYLDKHGSMSVAMNFHALSMFVHELGGSSSLTDTYQSNIKTCFFQLPKDQPSHLLDSVYKALGCFSPDDFHTFCHDIQEKSSNKMNFDQTLAVLRLSQYDADMFFKFRDEFRAGVMSNRFVRKDCILQTLLQVAQNVYDIHDSDDVFFEIAYNAFLVQEYALAVRSLLKSNALADQSLQHDVAARIQEARTLEPDSDRELAENYQRAEALYLLGLSYLKLNQIDQAKQAFRESVHYEPSFIERMDFMID